MMEFCDRDTAVGLWKTGNGNVEEIIVVSVHMDILLPGRRSLSGCWIFANGRKSRFSSAVTRMRGGAPCGEAERLTEEVRPWNI